MRVLLVDDHNQFAELASDELRNVHGFDVAYAIDPLAAAHHLRANEFDVVVVDVLYHHLTKRYGARRRSGQISIQQDRSFHLSGLAVLHEASLCAQPPRSVIWTIGDSNRELHMLFAYQQFAARVFCSKGPTSGRLSSLAEAIEIANAGSSYTDPLLDGYLPRERMQQIAASLFGKPLWRDIWRVFALGKADDLKKVGSLSGYSAKTVRNIMAEMARGVVDVNPFVKVGHKPMNVLVAFAESNWEFFLDDTAMRLYPPPIAKGIQPKE
jgi:DNA-binding NarL/FixJ family response regulator